MIRKIFICGAHSVGKSTLFECLKKYLRIENVKLLYYQEVARNLAEENNLTAKDFEDKEINKKFGLQTIKNQLKQEEDLQVKEEKSNVLAFFDRCLMDYLTYVGKRFNQAFADDLQNQPDILRNLQSLQEDNCLVLIIEPVSKLVKADGVRPGFVLTFDFVLKIHNELKETMTRFNVPFLLITVEDLQERFDLVVDEILKRWPDLKRGDIIPIADEDKPKTCKAAVIQSNDS